MHFLFMFADACRLSSPFLAQPHFRFSLFVTFLAISAISGISVRSGLTLGPWSPEYLSFTVLRVFALFQKPLKSNCFLRKKYRKTGLPADFARQLNHPVYQTECGHLYAGWPELSHRGSGLFWRFVAPPRTMVTKSCQEMHEDDKVNNKVAKTAKTVISGLISASKPLDFLTGFHKFLQMTLKVT